MARRTAHNRASQQTDEHIGSRIRLRRHMLRTSQQALGKAVGVTFQQIQKYENGTNRVGAGRLQQIADALDTEPTWFFKERPLANSGNSITGQRFDADLAAFFADSYAPKVICGFVRLPSRVKRAIVKVITAAAGLPEA
jgi:transcriptional regulator with XRE-family HTH domain